MLKKTTEVICIEIHGLVRFHQVWVAAHTHILLQCRRDSHKQVYCWHDIKNFLAPKYFCSCKTWWQPGGSLDQCLRTLQALTLVPLQVFGHRLLEVPATERIILVFRFFFHFYRRSLTY